MDNNQGKHKNKVVITVIVIFVILIAIGLIQSTARVLSGGSFVAPDGPSTASSSKETLKKNSQKAENDLDIITRNGHPTLYGSVKQSHKIWDDIKGNKIIFGDEDSDFDKNTIISMDALSDSDIIHELDIYFANAKNIAPVTVDQALSIATSYLPTDLIDKYYKIYSSEKAVPTEDYKKDNGTQYIVIYYKTDKADKTKAVDQYGPIVFIVETVPGNGDNVQDIQLTNDVPNWTMNLHLNGYKSKKWTFDISKYK